MVSFHFGQLLKNIKDNKTFRNGTLFSLFSVINRGFSFLLLLILANYITPEEYGYLSLFGTVVMVIGYFMAMSSDGYLSVTFFQDGEGGVKNCVSSILYTTLISSAFFLSVLGVFGGKLTQLLDLPLPVLYLSVIICFFSVYVNLNLDLYRLQERVGLYGVLTILNALLNFILSILLVKSFLLGWEGRVYAQTGCYTIFGIIGILVFVKRGSIGKPNLSYWKEMLLWGIPMIPHVATNFIRQGCDRYIINYYHSIEDVGLFSFALTIANLLLIIGIGFNQSYSVDVYKVLGDEACDSKAKIDRIRKLNRFIFVIYTVTFISVSVGASLLLPIALPKYNGCIGYIPVLSLSMYFNCLYFLYTNFLFFYKRTKWIMYTTLGCSVIHLILSLLLTRYSLYITAIIYCFSQLLILLVIRRLALKELETRLNIEVRI